MGKTIKLTLPSLIGALVTLASEGLSDGLEYRKEYAEKISPVDSGDYIKSHKIVSPTIKGSVITGGNENDSEHAFGVEYGFRRTPVNWHKGPPRSAGNKIYRGTGAKVLQRTGIDTVKEIQQFIINKINKG